jgi:hypothetical protein
MSMFTNSKMMTRVAAAAAVVMIGSDQKSFFANALQMTTSDHLSPTYVLGGPRPASPTNEEDGDVSREPVPSKNQDSFQVFWGRRDPVVLRNTTPTRRLLSMTRSMKQL